MLIEGDGHVDLANQDIYTTKSQQLAAGLSYALDQHGIEHSIHYRKDKKCYSIRSRPTNSERLRYTNMCEVRKSNEYVYDLEIEGGHTFVDGLGRVLLHNTDSVVTDYNDLPNSDELGALKKEFDGDKIRIIAYGPKTYVIEKDIPFTGEHLQAESVKDKEGTRLCLELCPGCFKQDGKLVTGQHQEENGKRLCMKECPGCATHKVMMKGVPKNLRTRKTLERMHGGKEEVSFQLHEKLGALAKAGLTRTPLMIDIKKSMKSTYDKRAIAPDGNDTLPLLFADPIYLHPAFIDKALDPNYRIPKWIGQVL